MRRIALILCGVIVTVLARAQELPVLETYILDPYVSNPAMITVDGYSQVNMVYRKQWTDIPDAPATLGINGQFVVTPRISIGGMITHDKSVILSATTVMATFAYQVPFADDHYLNFGLSGGFYSDRLRLDQIDNVSDPALYSNDSRWLAHVQFGMMYAFKKLRVGFVLPQMLDTYTHGKEDVAPFSPMRAKMVSLSYSLNLSREIAFEPFGQYYFDQNKKSYAEVGGLFNFKTIIRMGAFYRDQMGVGVLAQLAPTEKLLVGYSYQARSNSSTSFGGSSHEIQLKIRFGKKRVISKQTKAQKSGQPVAAAKPTEEQSNRTESIPAKDNEAAVQSSSDYTPAQLITAYSRADIETSKPDEPPYLVVGCFKSQQNAERLLANLQSRYPTAGLGYITSRQLYFVYAQTMSEADNISVDAILKIRKETAFKDAWFMKLQREE